MWCTRWPSPATTPTSAAQGGTTPNADNGSNCRDANRKWRGADGTPGRRCAVFVRPMPDGHPCRSRDEHLQKSGLLRAVPALHVRGWPETQSVQEPGELRPATADQTEKMHTPAGESVPRNNVGDRWPGRSRFKPPVARDDDWPTTRPVLVSPFDVGLCPTRCFSYKPPSSVGAAISLAPETNRFYSLKKPFIGSILSVCVQSIRHNCLKTTKL